MALTENDSILILQILRLYYSFDNSFIYFVSGKERIVSIKKQENPAISHLDCVTNLPEVACLCLKLNIWENYISILHTAVGLFYLL